MPLDSSNTQTYGSTGERFPQKEIDLSDTLHVPMSAHQPVLKPGRKNAEVPSTDRHERPEANKSAGADLGSPSKYKKISGKSVLGAAGHRNGHQRQ
jgi:hypothetical protein